MRDFIRFLLLRWLIFAVQTLPQRYTYWIALRVGDLNYFLLDPKGREAVLSNLRRVLSDAKEDRIEYEARWIFRNFAKYLTEFFRFRQFDEAYFQRSVMIKGKEILEKAMKEGKGCILLSSHLSNWEFGAAATSKLLGYKVNVVAASHRFGRIDRLFVRERESAGINVIQVEHAAREVLRALKRNEVVCILGDRDATDSGVQVDFFDKTCAFPKGPARFALKAGCPLIPGFVLRRTNDSFTIVFEQAIQVPSDGERDEKVRLMTQAFARFTEEAIRWHPEEWGVFYDVWGEKWSR